MIKTAEKRLEAGRSAVARRARADAYALLVAADGELDLAAEDLEALGEAARSLRAVKPRTLLTFTSRPASPAR